ncbi:MAG TPA: hypothetical protein VHG72_20730, partial [Polyangia bacterium]|nr:hypothetical protein [Polyangia bacterium]
MSARVVAVRAALLVAVLAGGACFRPSIKSGGFRCGGPHNDQCPDNFVCDKTTTLCVSSIDGGVGGAGGMGGAAGTGGHLGTGGMAIVCLPAVADTNCGTGGTVDAGGMCDPVCNTGCKSCDEKCSVNTAGTETCNAPLAGPPPALFGSCTPRALSGASSQTDNCAPGQVCLGLTTCGSECYQFCRSDLDCNGTSCTRDLGNGRLGCEVPLADCDPVKLKSGASNGCPGGNLGSCYLSGQTEHTLCDCQTYNPSVTGVVGDPCTHSRDCFAGLVCANEGQGLKCYQVCRLPGDGGVDLTRVDAGEQECASS